MRAVRPKLFDAMAEAIVHAEVPQLGEPRIQPNIARWTPKDTIDLPVEPEHILQ